MATAIRPIPTLQGHDATLFEEEARKVEDTPGTIVIPESSRNIYSQMLKKANLA